MLSVKKRLRLSLVLLPAIILPTIWLLLALNSLSSGRVTYGLSGLIVLGGATAFVTAYSIASFIAYMRDLQANS